MLSSVEHEKSFKTSGPDETSSVPKHILCQNSTGYDSHRLDCVYTRSETVLCQNATF